jgi:dTDP-4-dehydrorhamnose reductase
VRYAVLGPDGQLGQELCPRLPGEVVLLARNTIDLASPDRIPATLAALKADVLVNCAAYNFVDRAETEHEQAFAINAWGVRALARACAALRIRFVHFSSDYVFGLDGKRKTPLTEGDPPGPLGVYGLSKLAGEYFARAECPEALVIRTCGLYGSRGRGGKGSNFVETMLRLAGEGKPIRVVNDQRCTPSYTVDVAAATITLIDNRATGLFHVTNAGSCTWHEFAAEIFRLAGLKPNLIPIASSEYKSAAHRPAYSVLSNDKLGSEIGKSPPAWSEAIAAYLAERVNQQG